MITAALANPSEMPGDYQAGWDNTVGLWKRTGPGHTRGVHELQEVHDCRMNMARLVSAGLDGLLGTIPTSRVLAAMESMQQVDGPQRGCFRWYFEEREIRDTNAAFFIGLPLLAIRTSFADQLADEDLARIDRMLVRLGDWFDRELSHPLPRYPNKYLGDLVCAWLLAEQTGVIAPELPARMLEAATYWRDQEWGWGEHLSDLYAHICLDELSMLLLLSRRLPAEVRVAYEQLRDELLAIDDLYAGGPRVPTIRCYAFTTVPKAASYRQLVRPWRAGELPVADPFQPLRGLAHRLGWHERVPPPAAVAASIDIACYGGAHARAVIDGPLRLGAMSRYPIMDGIDHPTWGLSWQSFPVAAWHASGDWLFLQWETTEDGRCRAHPAESKAQSYLDNALSLKLDPPPVGQTFTVQIGSAFVVLRRMPRVSTEWPEVIDRVRLIGGHAKLDEAQDDAGTQLRLTYRADDGSTRRLAIRFIDPRGQLSPQLNRDREGLVDWTVRHPLGHSTQARAPFGIWVWSVGDDLSTPPKVEPLEDGWRLAWERENGRFVVCVRPAESEPLRVE